MKFRREFRSVRTSDSLTADRASGYIKSLNLPGFTKGRHLPAGRQARLFVGQTKRPAARGISAGNTGRQVDSQPIRRYSCGVRESKNRPFGPV